MMAAGEYVPAIDPTRSPLEDPTGSLRTAPETPRRLRVWLRRLRDYLRRFSDFRRRHRTRVLFGLNLVVSVSVGYLLEKLILRGWSAGDWCLLALAVIAAWRGYELWNRTRSEAADHGVILNIAAGPQHYRARRDAEQATLIAWAANRYPNSVVMSHMLGVLPAVNKPASTEPAPAQADPKRDAAIGSFGLEVADKVLSAAVLAAGAERFVILPAGVPEAVVQVAAGLWPLLGDSAKLASDVSDDKVPEPVFTFQLPPTPTKATALQRLKVHGTRPMVGLLNEPPPAEAQYPPPPPLREESVHRFGQPRGEGVLPADVGVVAENEAACEAVLESWAARLPSPEPPGEGSSEAGRARRLYVVSNAPEALVFGAGMIAARAGWQVGSAVYHLDTDSYSRYSEASLPDLSRLGVHLREGEGRQRARDEWHRCLNLSSAMLAIGVPLATGAFALLLEWGVARSQGPESGALHLMPCWLQDNMCGVDNGLVSWVLAGAVLALGVGLVALGWRTRQAISCPKFVVDVSETFPEDDILQADIKTRTIRAWRCLGTEPQLATLNELHTRFARDSQDWDDALDDDQSRAWRKALREAAQPYVDWLQTRLVEILAAFPQVQEITLRIPTNGFGPSEWPQDLRAKLTEAVVRGVNTGFRGNQPLTLQCGAWSEKLMPRSGAGCQEMIARANSAIEKAAVKAMSRMGRRAPNREKIAANAPGPEVGPETSGT